MGNRLAGGSILTTLLTLLGVFGLVFLARLVVPAIGAVVVVSMAVDGPKIDRAVKTELQVALLVLASDAVAMPVLEEWRHTLWAVS